MIIKQTRVVTGDASKLAKYLSSEGENENVEFLSGWLEGIGTNDAIAALWGRTYSCRHFIIAPSQKLLEAELAEVIGAILTEFEAPPRTIDIINVVLHEKKRSDNNDGARFHYHVVVPEVEPYKGRVLSSSFTKMRNEKLARLLELKLGHDVVPGKFNREVYEALRSYKVDLQPYEDALRASCRAEGMNEARWLDYRARAAFSEGQIHAAERTSRERGETRFTSPQVVRQHIRDLMTTKDLSGVLDELTEQGFSIEPGRKSGTWILSKDDIEFGSLDRLTKLKKEVVNEEAERRFGRQAFWNGSGSDASRHTRNEGYSQGDQGLVRRARDRGRQAYSSGTDTGGLGNDVSPHGQNRGNDETASRTRSISNSSAQSNAGRNEKPQFDAKQLGKELRRDETLKRRSPAFQERLARLRAANERGRHRANILAQANDLVRSSDVGDGEYIGIDGEGFDAVAAFFRRWAAQQAKTMRP